MPLTGDVDGTTITWTSDNTDVVDISGGAATVTRPADGDRDIILTATITDSSGNTATKTITVTIVKATDASTDASALDFSDFTFAGSDTETTVTDDFTVPTLGDVNGSTISWTSDNTSVVSFSGGTATVTQPSGSSETVTLTATITDGDGNIITRTFAVTVLSQVTYTITFDKNNASATGTMADQTFDFGTSAALTTNAFALSGYTFSGWSTTSGGAVEFTDGESYTMGSGDVTLYAVWTVNSYTITFDKNNASATGTMADLSLDYGTSSALTANAYSLTGNTFQGWSTSSSGLVGYTDGQSYTMGAADVTLYAVWEPDFPVVSTFAGTAEASGTDDGTGSDARFESPEGIASDGTNLYVADTFNNLIRKIVIATGEVTTLAGSGAAGSDDGTGTAATFNKPSDLATDGTNLYVVDADSANIRQIVISTGVVTTLVSGLGAYPYAITTDNTNLYVTDPIQCVIRQIVISNQAVSVLAGSGSPGSADGTGAAASFNWPYGITIDGTDLYVADTSNNLIRKIVIGTGVVTTIAGSGSSGYADGTGTAAVFNSPQNLTTDGTDLYVSDKSNQRIRKIDISTNEVSTLVGTGDTGSDDGKVSVATFNSPCFFLEKLSIMLSHDFKRRNSRQFSQSLPRPWLQQYDHEDDRRFGGHKKTIALCSF
ncbi:MAG: InlB B-repeat-containing protein [Spirochaetales bacterium]|nr:InlB B-repeat-containing protein [Spirochaetales bacterium]